MKVQVGTRCYPKAAPNAYGQQVLSRIASDLLSSVRGDMEEDQVSEILRRSVIQHIGIDLLDPCAEVLAGEIVVTPGGNYKEGVRS